MVGKKIALYRMKIYVANAIKRYYGAKILRFWEAREKQSDNHRLIYSTKINYESVVVDFVYCYNSGRGDKHERN